MSGWTSSNSSRLRSVSPCKIYSLSCLRISVKSSMRTNSCAEPPPPEAKLSAQDFSSTPWMKPPADQSRSDIHDEGDLPPYDLRFDPRVAKRIESFGDHNPDFVPLIARMRDDLQRDPNAYPLKKGKLAEARAYHIEYRGATWRAVFIVDDDLAEVRVISFGPHDQAYAQAERRI